MVTLNGLIQQCLAIPIDSDQAVNVVRTTVEYLCGISNAYDFQREIKKFVDFSELEVSAKDFRLLITDHSYLTLNIKFFAFNLIVNPINSDMLTHYAEAFCIVRNDVVLLRRSVSGKFRTNARKSRRILDLNKEDINVESVIRARTTFNMFYPELMVHIKRKTYKKMRFLVRSENVEFSDFNGELLYKAVKAFYLMVPTDKCDAHILNYLRTVCTNHALNIIESKTTDKRRRMLNEGSDGFGGFTFSLSCMSENQMPTSEENVADYENILSSANIGDPRRLLEDVNYESMIRTYGKTEKRKRIISILYGYEDPIFTRFLRNRNIIREDEDNTDFVRRNSLTTITNKLADHLHVCSVRLESFILLVGDEVKNNRSVA